MGIPNWFQSGWPFEGKFKQDFYALDPWGTDEIERDSPTLEVDLGKFEFAVGFQGIVNNTGKWGALYRQSLLAKKEDTWFLLLAAAKRVSIPVGDEPIDLENCETPMYLDLKHKLAEGFIQTLMSRLEVTGFEEFENCNSGLTLARS